MRSNQNSDLLGLHLMLRTRVFSSICWDVGWDLLDSNVGCIYKIFRSMVESGVKSKYLFNLWNVQSSVQVFVLINS